MAVEIKVAPDEKLELVQVLIEDTNPTSEYFNITELPDTLSGGKNAFLIAGSDKLLSNTEVKVQIRDANGKVLYHEFSNGYPVDYYEGNSKVCAVYVYPTDTAFGPATITILGQLKDTPIEWNNRYSVKWTKTININPALPNTTRVRFYKRPKVTITELLEPLYSIVSGSKVASLVTQSFASITVNQLETFAGDVARVKVFRTSAGDISDYELIQDIGIESRNLLTTYELSSSVVANAGLFTSESLSAVWNTSSLNATLNSTWVDDGVELTGSGTLKYTSSLNLLASNTYELQLDAFYTGSHERNLVAYISGTQNGEFPITTFTGSIPTKNFGTTTTAFTIPKDEPTASLYFSQSSGTNQWHIGNISLNLSQDTAFSPNEISFITSMPTVLGNETFNFKFEFYDINNNYVPVAVTASALFNGGNNNIGGTLIIISSSTSASNAYTSEFSQSYFKDVWSGSNSLSGSLTSSISKSASEVSASSANFIILVSGSLSSSINVVSGSVYNLSSSVSTSLSNLSSSIYTAQSNSLYNVYSASQFLDTFIFTDQNGKLNQPPTASGNGLFLGSTYLGFYSSSATSSTSGWKTYMDNQGDFYLTGSNGQFLAWAGQLGTLQVQGQINIQEGGITNAATKAGVTASVNSGTSSLSASITPNIFTDVSGNIVRPPNVLVGTSNGLYLGSTNLGFYSGSSWKTYMDNTGNFYLSGTGSNYLTWQNNVLTIAGAINIVGGNAATTSSVNTISASAWGSYTSASAYSSSIYTTTNNLDSRIFNDTVGLINKTATPSGAGLYLGSKNLGYYDGGKWSSFLSSSGIFYLTGSAGGNALLWDGSNLTINGTINVTGGTAATSASVYSVATTSANTAYTNASASAYTQAGAAYTNASASAYLQASSAYTNAKAVADSIASGSSNGTFINGSSVISPIIAGNLGYFSGKVTVGSGANPIVLDATTATRRIYVGTGTYNNTNTAVYMDGAGQFSLKDKLTWDGTTLSINGNITVAGGNAATSASVYTVATNAANSAESNAISSASGSAWTMASAAYTNAKAVADSIAAGTYSGGTFISSTTIASPIIAGNLGYFSGKVTVGNTNSIVLDATTATRRIYVGAGNYNNTDTSVYLDGSGQFSLKDKLSWDGSTLSINGTVTATLGSIGGWDIATDKLKSTDNITRLDSTNKEFAVMDSSNTNYYRVRIGNTHPTMEWPAGTGFIGTPQLNSFTEIVPGGIRLTAGVAPTSQVVYSQMDGYSGSTGIGVGIKFYSEVAGTNASSPIYIAMNNSTGTTNSLSSIYTNGGMYIENTSDLNQGFATIAAGSHYFAGPGLGTGGSTNIHNQLYLTSVVLNPSNPGTNDTLKIVRSNGYVFSSSSSRKTKNIFGNWKENENVLEIIQKVPVERFKYKKWADDEVETFGLIAEDLHNNGFWQAVTYEADKNGKAIYEEEKVSGIDYEKVTSILWKAVQELTKKVELLENKLK